MLPGEKRLTVRQGGLGLALTLLTAIPLSRPADGLAAPTRRAAGAAMAWAPAVGLLLGAAAAGILELAAQWGRTGPLLAAVLAVATLALLTRGLHLDGLADLADGLGSRQPADAALAIMKRSDIGPFGVVTLVFTLLVQVAALTQAQALGRGVPALIAASAAGRLALTWACRRGVPAARGSGLGALVAGSVHPAIPVALSAAALAAAFPFGIEVLAGVAAGVAVSLAVAALAVRRLGGITGDVLGALVEVATATCLLATAIR
jgi:adenosylcobinamide-GDP ribazoletransferase